MGRIVKPNQPCPVCPSSDAYQIYEDGGSTCFSCGKSWKKAPTKGSDEKEEFQETETKTVKAASLKIKSKKHKPKPVEEIETYPTKGFKERGITRVVAAHYGVKVSYDKDGIMDCHYYPYGTAEKRGYKTRILPKVDFIFSGKFGGLFGRELFAGGGKRLIITEGEIDAMTVAQATFDRYKKFYPIVSLPMSTGTSALLEDRDWIRSFQEVILWLDNDEAGKISTEKAIKIIGADKVKLVKVKEKDASELYTTAASGAERVLQAVWDAEVWRPAGIIGKEELWKAMSDYNDVKALPYPDCLGGLNSRIKGARLGEITLFISGTGSGKSTIVREIALHFLKIQEDKIGIISLEESPGETARLFSGMAIRRNPAEEDLTIEELQPGFEEVFGDDRVTVLDHQGSIKDSSILDQLEYMCLTGCKYLFIDHITILVSEGADALSGNEAIDKIMNDLLRLVKRHNVWVCLISHLRKAPSGKKSFEEGLLPSVDDIRGSGSIKQVSFDIVAFARDMTSASESVRNTILMSSLKSRTTGKTGPVRGAIYDVPSGRLSAVESEDFEDFEIID